MCGTKLDLAAKAGKVTRADAAQFAGMQQLSCEMQTSAKTKENLQKFFLDLATELYAYRNNFAEKRGDTFTVRWQTEEEKMAQAADKQKKGGCC